MPRPAPHPTALALFNEFERQDDESDKKKNNKSDLIQRRTQSLGWRSRYSQAEEYPVTVSGHAYVVRQKQRGEVEGTYGTGATVWPASMVLLKYLEKNPEKIRGKSVVELGAGTGIVSLAAAFLGAAEVVCTDGTEKVVDLASENVRLSPDTPVPIVVRKYWWADGSLGREYDVVLVSDCVLPKLYPIEPLVEGLLELMSQTSIAIVSYEHRHYPHFHPAERFRELCKASDLTVCSIPSEDLDSVYSVDDIQVWLVARK